MKDDRLKPVITEQPVTASHNVTPSRSAASQPTESKPTASQRTFHQQHISPVTAASTASTVMTSSPATTVTASSFYRVRHVEKNFLPGHELNLNLDPSKHQKTKKKYEWELSNFLPFHSKPLFSSLRRDHALSWNICMKPAAYFFKDMYLTQSRAKKLFGLFLENTLGTFHSTWCSQIQSRHLPSGTLSLNFHITRKNKILFFYPCLPLFYC